MCLPSAAGEAGWRGMGRHQRDVIYRLEKNGVCLRFYLSGGHAVCYETVQENNFFYREAEDARDKFNTI